MACFFLISGLFYFIISWLFRAFSWIVGSSARMLWTALIVWKVSEDHGNWWLCRSPKPKNKARNNFMAICPQQLEKPGVLPTRLWGGSEQRPETGTRFPKVPQKDSTLQKVPGFTKFSHTGSGPQKFHIKVPHWKGSRTHKVWHKGSSSTSFHLKIPHLNGSRFHKTSA